MHSIVVERTHSSEYIMHRCQGPSCLRQGGGEMVIWPAHQGLAGAGGTARAAHHWDRGRGGGGGCGYEATQGRGRCRGKAWGLKGRRWSNQGSQHGCWGWNRLKDMGGIRSHSSVAVWSRLAS